MINFPSSCDRIRNILLPKVVITPQILLHVDATPSDLFRGLIVVHKMLDELYASSERVTDLDQATAAMLLLNFNITKQRISRTKFGVTESTILAPEEKNPALEDDPSFDSFAGTSGVSLQCTYDSNDCNIDNMEMNESEELRVLESVGLDWPSLLGMVERALEYETAYGPLIEETLEAAGGHKFSMRLITLLQRFNIGWNTKRFMFGTIRARVEW